VNSIKSLIIVALLAAIGIGLYLKINSLPEPEPPEEFTGTYGVPPKIEMRGPDETGFEGIPPMPLANQGSTPPGGDAPAFDAGGGGTAPTFDGGPPQTSGGNAPPIGAGAPEGSDLEPPTVNPLAGPPVQDPFAGQNPPQMSPPGPSSPAGPTQNNRQRTQDAPPPSPWAQPSHASFDEAWQSAQDLLARGELAEAHLLLSGWYGHPTLLDVEQQELMRMLSGLAGTVIYSTEHHLEPPYYVKPGETLEKIARQYEVPTELLARINGISGPLRPGQAIKVVRGPFEAVVDAKRKELVLVLAGRYAGRFPVGFGEDRGQVQGVYQIAAKQNNPTYHGPQQTVGPGDPNNPLGSLLLSLKKSLDNAAELPFGIHGTNDPATVARDSGPGYIRLTPQDIEDAGAILSVGSRVIIRR